MTAPVEAVQSDRGAELAALRAEVTRLRSLLIDPGSPKWEDARSILVGELRKADLHAHAQQVADAEGVYIPSWIALNLIAQAREAASAPSSDVTLREALERRAAELDAAARNKTFDPDVARYAAQELRAIALRTPSAQTVGEDMPAEMTAEERRFEDLKQQAAYAGLVVSFDVRDPYYLASCDHCGWVGSTELCGTDSWGDDSDVYCPRCHTGGADCGQVAEKIEAGPSAQPADRAGEVDQSLLAEANSWYSDTQLEEMEDAARRRVAAALKIMQHDARFTMAIGRGQPDTHGRYCWNSLRFTADDVLAILAALPPAATQGGK